MNEKEAVEKVSQIWCLPETARIEMGVVIANVMVKLLVSETAKARKSAAEECVKIIVGNAITRGSLQQAKEEIESRFGLSEEKEKP